MTDNDDDTSKLGYSLSMSTDENFVVAGAPYANTLATDGSTRFNDSGLVKVYLWDSTAFKYNLLNTIKPPQCKLHCLCVPINDLAYCLTFFLT